jgi:hypothetical protein
MTPEKVNHSNDVSKYVKIIREALGVRIFMRMSEWRSSEGRL